MDESEPKTSRQLTVVNSPSRDNQCGWVTAKEFERTVHRGVAASATITGTTVVAANAATDCPDLGVQRRSAGGWFSVRFHPWLSVT